MDRYVHAFLYACAFFFFAAPLYLGWVWSGELFHPLDPSASNYDKSGFYFHLLWCMLAIISAILAVSSATRR